MSWYFAALRKYLDFGGRARRTEYWMFTLFNVLISCALALIDRFKGNLNAQAGIGLLSGVYSLAMLLPALAVSVRRLHDTDRSGWWILFGLIPCAGIVVLLFFMVKDGTPGANQY